MQAFEANFDGLVGPTHNYAGLSFGNVASRNNEKSAANPKAAAKQGLRKMKQLADLGFHQGVLPPLERPSLKLLRSLGFTGDDGESIGGYERRPRAFHAGQSQHEVASCDRA